MSRDQERQRDPGRDEETTESGRFAELGFLSAWQAHDAKKG
jgi:hypothetical protein